MEAIAHQMLGGPKRKYVCACGLTERLTSLGVDPCEKCIVCGESLAVSGAKRRAARDHDWMTYADGSERCRWCGSKKEAAA